MRDKQYGYYRIVDISNWADRNFYFLGRWYDLEAALALRTLLRPGHTVIDVGANFGHFSLEAAKQVGSTGRVIAFEPNPKVFARLVLHCDLNALTWVETHNTGLSDTDGQLTLKVPHINPGEATFGKSEYTDIAVQTVSVRRLDDVIGDDKVDFLKIDVEGFEPHVLRGGLTVLKHHKPILITEVIAQHLANSGGDRNSISDILAPLGYRSFKLGLKGRGRHQNLHLREKPQLDEDGDYLWVPVDRVQEVAPFLD